MPNGASATDTKAVAGGRATRIADYTKHGIHMGSIGGRHAGNLGAQTRSLKRGLKGTGIRVARSNKGIGAASQQVSDEKARARAQAWREGNIKKARKIMGNKAPRKKK